MSKANPALPAYFPALLREIKNRVQEAQTRAVLAVNGELAPLYWDIGRLIAARQQREGWGPAVIPRLARELANELPEVKGFSERNIGRMIGFYREYPTPSDFLPRPAAKLPLGKTPQPVAKFHSEADSLLWAIPWGHHARLLEKVKDPKQRHWYMTQTLANGWSRNVLLAMVQSEKVKPIRPQTRQSQNSRGRAARNERHTHDRTRTI